MKSIIRWVYLLLVGLIVFTGALFIAKGSLDGDQKPTVTKNPVAESAETPKTGDAASPAPEYHAPDGPALFI